MVVLVLSEICPYNENGYIHCDFCSESALTDSLANRPDRLMYLIENEGLKVCENCLPELGP